MEKLQLAIFSAKTQTMPKAHSDDLRCKILQAYEGAEIGLEQLAKQFGVSYGFTKKIRRQQLQSGQMERPPQRLHGPASRATEPVKQYLRRQIQAQPDLTLAELRQRLEHGMHVQLSKSRLWGVLQELGLRRKKTLHASEQETPNMRGRGC